MFNYSLAQMLNQTVTLSTLASRDKYNEPTYTESEVKARSEGKRRQVTLPSGDRVVSSTTVITQAEVTTDDLIDGRQVLEVLDMRDGSGALVSYEVLLK